MSQLSLKTTPKQKGFVNDVHAAWEELEDAFYTMCVESGIDEDAASDMLADMRIHIELVWNSYKGSDNDF